MCFGCGRRRVACGVGGVCGCASGVVQRGIAGAPGCLVAGRTRIFYGDQSAQLTDIRQVRSDQAVWSFSSQQATLRRLNKAFDGFFGGLSEGRRPAIPVKGEPVRWAVAKEVTAPLAVWVNRVYLQGIGRVKAEVHRQVLGRVKTIQVKQQGRRWILVLSCDDVPAHLAAGVGPPRRHRCGYRQFRHHQRR